MTTAVIAKIKQAKAEHPSFTLLEEKSDGGAEASVTVRGQVFQIFIYPDGRAKMGIGF